MPDPSSQSGQLRQRVWQPPWMILRQPLETVASRRGEAVYVVGGFLRDLLRGQPPVDLDLTVVGDAPAFARELVAELPTEVKGEQRTFPRFGTAELWLGEFHRVDLSSARGETYEAPGALPKVHHAGIDVDLARRDFTVNTLALGLAGGAAEELMAHPSALSDLDRCLVRVLHRASFRDDPTRILRAVDLEARLGGRMESETEVLARRAVEEGALATISPQRLWSQMRSTLTSEVCVPQLRRWHELGVLTTLLGDQVDWLARLETVERVLEEGVELFAGAWGETARRGAVLLALAGTDPVEEGGRWSGLLPLSRDERRLMGEGVERIRRARADLENPDLRASAAHRLMSGMSEAELALLAVTGGERAGAWVEREVAEMRPLELTIAAADLLARGAAAGRDLGRALEATLWARLDEDIEPSGELEYALRRLGLIDADADPPD